MSDPTPPTAAPLTPRRLMLLWLSWTVATAVGFTAGWEMPFAWFPSDSENPSGGVMSHVELFFGHLTPALWAGLAQYVVLRFLLHPANWLPWIIVTAIGHAAGNAVISLFTDPFNEMFFSDSLIIRCWISAMHYGSIGIAVGVLQTPILLAKFKGRRWWSWPFFSAIGTTCGGVVWLQMLQHYPFGPDTLAQILQSSTYGLISGLALVLLLRGTTIPQVKNEAKAQ